MNKKILINRLLLLYIRYTRYRYRYNYAYKKNEKITKAHKKIPSTKIKTIKIKAKNMY